MENFKKCFFKFFYDFMFFQFSQVLGFIWAHSDPFGPIRTHSDLFRCARMRLDAFGNNSRISGNFDFLFFFVVAFDVFRWLWGFYEVF